MGAAASASGGKQRPDMDARNPALVQAIAWKRQAYFSSEAYSNYFQQLLVRGMEVKIYLDDSFVGDVDGDDVSLMSMDKERTSLSFGFASFAFEDIVGVVKSEDREGHDDVSLTLQAREGLSDISFRVDTKKSRDILIASLNALINRKKGLSAPPTSAIPIFEQSMSQFIGKAPTSDAQIEPAKQKVEHQQDKKELEPDENANRNKFERFAKAQQSSNEKPDDSDKNKNELSDSSNTYQQETISDN